MELPTHLKNLYRHWGIHVVTNNVTTALGEVVSDSKLEEELSWFIHERIAIWEQKTLGGVPPYTNDPLLSRYRFCNIFREFDMQTIEFHTLLNPQRDNFPLWLLNVFYCRMVANTATIKQVGLLSFDKKENEIFYKKLMASPRPRFGTPYVFPVSAIMKSKTPTRELFIARHLPMAMSAIAKEISKWKKVSVYDGVEKIIPLFGFNLYFLWTEVLIDVAYQFPEYLDLFERFPIGPGSLPTMQRIDKEKDPTMLVSELGKTEFNTNITIDKKPLRLSAENWEGVGCEFRKYTNLKAGKGRKRIFKK